MVTELVRTLLDVRRYTFLALSRRLWGEVEHDEVLLAVVLITGDDTAHIHRTAVAGCDDTTTWVIPTRCAEEVTNALRSAADATGAVLVEDA